MMAQRGQFRSMRPYVSLAILVLLCADATPGMAQRASPSWISFSSPLLVSAAPPAGLGATAAVPSNLPDTYPGTYRTEGAVVGAILLGVVGALLVDRFCGNDRNGSEEHCSTKALGGAALGAGIGFTVGGLLGARFPKGT